MGFENCTGFSFDEQTIRTLNSDRVGVYAIYRNGAWIYIGRGNLRTELLRYVGGENPKILAERPTHFFVIDTNDDVAEEKRLILKHTPIVNERIG